HYQQHKNDHNGQATWKGYILHKGAHTMLGASTAAGQKIFIEGDTKAQEVLYAALSGATGAVCAEAIAEYHLDFSVEGEQLVKDIESQGIEPTLNNIKDAYHKKVMLSGMLGEMAAVTVAYALDLDIETANRAADNAIDNNFAATAATATAGAMVSAPALLIGGAMIVTVGGVGYLVVTMYEKHRTNRRKSNKNKHEKGEASRRKARSGKRKFPPKKRPKDWKGPWPPKKWPPKNWPL
ncbi:MAG: hypothetical protein AAF335_04595, partial [Bacteroidota bacterium]